MPKFIKKRLHLYITGILFVLFVITFVIALREYRAKDLQKIEPCNAACDTSFFSIQTPPGMQSTTGCLTVGQQLYTDDTRYTFFRFPSTVASSIAYVRTQNVQVKDATSLNWQVSVTKATRVYVFARYIPGMQAPSWIRSGYTRRTNDDLSNINQFVLRKNPDGLIGLYEVYTKDVSAGTVQFYSASDNGNAYSMYMVALEPLSGSPSPTSTVRPSSSASPTINPSSTTQPTAPPTGSLRFISWGDTKGGLSTLTALSKQAKNMNSLFTIYAGDLCDSGFSTSCIAPWKTALNGGENNGMFDKTFAVRGNHDKTDAAGWSSYFNFGMNNGVASRIGAKNYSGDNLTYSFDVGNSHIVGIDVLGDAGSMSSTQRTWLDSDLSAAEGRGITHSFLFWHGPIYPVAEHCCSDNSWATAIINKHPSVSATFHGHEHVYAYVYVDTTRYSNVTHPFEEFVTGDAGAGPNTCKAGRTDYCMQKHGFVVVDVNNRNFTVSMYSQGANAPEKVWNFTK